MPTRQEFFEEVYNHNLWGSNESRSGQGSELRSVATLRQELPSMIRYLGVRSILDAPCGDYNWMQHMDLGDVHYIGGDIVPELVETNQRTYGKSNREFVRLDLVSDSLPKVDLLFCRDCLIHFSLELIEETLENVRASGIEYVMLTHDNSLARYAGIQFENVDLARTQAGVNFEFRPLNFMLPPFSFPPPRYLINEGLHDNCKTMALWRTTDLATTIR
ncbi:class I SAM-dependent methyltransferase [Burkholderia lata]|uniref:Class I SAM-dependent methyltransferase n=1 Tax=Burkholderia lata (strain ATCC 17760 / DSM 23089 / LMG 22485 / NCIMB 9086 / R18194 / 383) TaxID=482957 RepID=A0A6P2NTC7_BURL3|nr:class I SAM-dependent methyltransferase [Burkholderia lata]VWB98128.1 hypothetical protein BLA6863_04711 [Burkholderia lata]